MKRPAILILKLSAIGDVVHTLPALNALRQHYPESHITWVVEEAAADLVVGHKALDQVLVSRRKAWLNGLQTGQRRQSLEEIWAFVRTLRRRRYDLLFDFQFSLKGAIWIALTRADRKIGFGRGLAHQEHSYLVLNERLPAVSMEVHALERSLILLKSVGIETDRVAYDLPIGDSHRQRAVDLLAACGIAEDQAYVVINPMAKWESKLWDPHKFALVADAVQHRYRLPVVFTGAPEDRVYNDGVLDRMTSAGQNLAGRTDLMTLAAVMLEPSGPAEGIQGPVQDADRDFLAALAEMTRKAGALLIFDEILTGYRYPSGSVQKATGIVPDLACFGKALANGMPLSALVGRADIFQRAAERIHYGPTFKGELYSFAAARAAIWIYRNEPVAQTVWDYGTRLRDGINDLCRRLGIAANCLGPPFRMALHFDEPNPERLGLKRTLYIQELLKSGIITYNGVMLPSYAHDDRVFDRTLTGIEKALETVSAAAQQGDFHAYIEIPLLS